MTMPNIISYGDLRAAEKTGTRDTVVTSNLGFLIALRGNADARDRLAEAAMQGLCANSGGPFQARDGSGWELINCTLDDVARLAYQIADAMLEAREA